MNMPEAVDAAPLTDEMLLMDVADTLRRGIDVPLDPAPADELLVGKLRAIYLQQGISASDTVLAEGVAAMRAGRFAYVPPRGRAASLARLYVSRDRWGPSAFAVLVALVVGLGGYFFVYQPYIAGQAEQARQELAQGLPAEMDGLYQAIFNETKVQTAAADAAELRDHGKAAAQKGDRAGAEQAVTALKALRDQLALTYSLRIVDQDGVKPGFWRFPPSNSEATNYYIVVEAVDEAGHVLTLPVTSEETGLTQNVNRWGLRVPQSVYDAVMSDKADDGRIDHGLVGFKQDGFIDIDYAVPVLGGTVTQW